MVMEGLILLMVGKGKAVQERGEMGCHESWPQEKCSL